MSYGEVTKQLENPKAERAVGTACGKNPIGVLIACPIKTAYLILTIDERHKQFLSIPASIFINALISKLLTDPNQLKNKS